MRVRHAVCSLASLGAMVLAVSSAGAKPYAGAEVKRLDHVRIWVSDPQLMPTRSDGGSWVVEGKAPSVQLSIRTKRGTFRSSPVQSTSPSFNLRPIEVGPGEPVHVNLWELEELGKSALGGTTFNASLKPDSAMVSSTSVMLMEVRSAPVDVWSIPELSLVVPVRVDDALMEILETGIKAFHYELHKRSRGQIRIERYRYYERPSGRDAERLQKSGIVLSAPGKDATRKLAAGTPAAPAAMALPPVALTSAQHLSAELLAAFESGVLGATTPEVAPEPVGDDTPDGAPAEVEEALPPKAPWDLVRYHFDRDLKLALLPATSSKRTTVPPRPDINIVRSNTLDASAGSVASGAGPSLSADAIREVLGKNAASLGRCLVKSKARQATIQVTVGGDGKVSELVVNGESSGTLQGCLFRAASRLSFPALGGGQTHAMFSMSI